MARIGAGDTTGDTTEETDSTDDAGSDTSIEDKQTSVVEEGDSNTDPDISTGDTSTPDPSQPARGRGDTGSDTGSTVPDPTDDAGSDTSAEDRGDDLVDRGNQNTNPAVDASPTDDAGADTGTREKQDQLREMGDRDTEPVGMPRDDGFDAGADTSAREKRKQLVEGFQAGDESADRDGEVMVPVDSGVEGQGLETSNERAAALEARWLSENSEFDNEDIAVQRDGDTLRLRFTESGAAMSVAEQIRDRPTTRPGDVRVENGTVFVDITRAGELTESQQMDTVAGNVNRTRAQQLADIDFSYTDESVAKANRELAGERGALTSNAISRIEDELGVDLSREDVEITRDGNRTEVTLSEQGKRTVREQNEAFDDPTIMIPGQVAGVNVPGGGKSVERVLRDFQMGVGRWAERNVQSGPQTSRWAQMGIEPADRGPRQKAITGWSEEVGQSLASTPALLANVPLGAKEGYGWYKEAAENPDNPVGFYKKTGSVASKRVAGAAEYAWNNPGESSARVVGSLLGTGLVMGGAAAVSSRAGAASRWTIQPGEEALGTAGYHATRRLRNQKAADRYFPNKEPLIFSEEAAIRGVNRARAEISPRAKAAAVRARSEMETFAQSNRGQWQIGRTETEGAKKETITAEDLADQNFAEPDRGFEPLQSDPTGPNVPRKPVKAGINEQGSFVGSYTRAQDPAFGGSGKPNQAQAKKDTSFYSEEQLARVRAAQSGPSSRARQRLEAAQRPNARVYEMSLSGVDQQAATARAVSVDAYQLGMLSMAQRMRVQNRLGTEEVVASEFKTAIENELAMETEAKTEAKAEARARADTQTEFETRFEYEGRFEFESRGRSDPPVEVEPETDGADNEPNWGVDMQGSDGQGSTSSPVDRDAGWINKWATALAGGGIEARRAPENVADYAGDPLPAPTVAQTEGKTEAVEDFFDFSPDSNNGGWGAWL